MLNTYIIVYTLYNSRKIQYLNYLWSLQEVIFLVFLPFLEQCAISGEGM